MKLAEDLDRPISLGESDEHARLLVARICRGDDGQRADLAQRDIGTDASPERHQIVIAEVGRRLRHVEYLAVGKSVRRDDAVEVVLDIQKAKVIPGDCDHEPRRMGYGPLHRHARALCRKVVRKQASAQGTRTALPTTVRSSISLKPWTQSARSKVPAIVALSLSSVNQRISSACAAATMARRFANDAASLSVGSPRPPQPV